MARKQPKTTHHDGAKKRAVGVTPSAGAPVAEKPGASGDGRPPKRSLRWLAVVVTALTVLLGGLAFHLLGGNRSAAVEAAAFVGSTTCAECHRAQAELWRPSQHRLAMQHATHESVLGNFQDASFDHAGVHSRFFRKAGKFFVETDGTNGKLAVFEVKYTFGLDPLQQYLVEFADGRLQALSIAWDSRPADKGGQRWFHLYPDERIGHADSLHWTRLNQNWNFMCAECHSMGVQKNYDAATDRFATTWAEISVGCEACHGQGSRHVAWAREGRSLWPFGKRDDPNLGLLARFAERRDATWVPNTATGNAVRSRAAQPLRTEVEACGRCHGRRGQFSEDWIPGQSLSDTHAVSPLGRGLYHADGQMLDEVYNYGSFKQSKMFAAGVTCSDCHEPHSTRLRAEADGLCGQCHAPAKYAAASHHHHERADAKPTCVSCHMPARTYMVVDRRHDHSFRIPRPDLSHKLGTPNACTDCHTDKAPAWAASAIERWHGPDRQGFQTYAQAFHAAWHGGVDAAKLLGTVAADRNAPAIARGSALSELGAFSSPSGLELARASLVDPDPMVRIGALELLEAAPEAGLWPLVSPLLSDPVRGVRIRAVSVLAAVPSADRPGADRERFERAAGEFLAAQRLNADRPEARTTSGNFLTRLGRAAEAEAEYRAALRLSPQFAAAAVNLADLFRQLRRDAEGETVLRAAVAASPLDAALHHALGLVLTRLKQPDAALAELRRAAELQPQTGRYAYVYAVALHSSGRRNEALNVLKRELATHPGNRDALMAMISFSREAGDTQNALEAAARLQLAAPDPELARLIEELRRQAGQLPPRGR